jgi:hypothetical protein
LSDELAGKFVAELLVAGQSFDEGDPSLAVDGKAQAEGIGGLCGSAGPSPRAGLDDGDSRAQVANFTVTFGPCLKPAGRLSSRIAAMGTLSVSLPAAPACILARFLLWQSGQGIRWNLAAVTDQTGRPYSSGRTVGVGLADRK